jgi:GTP cyclohydrolase IB
MLPDVQASQDERNIPVDEVGVAGIRYPVAVADREHGKQNTVAEVSMSVNLPAGVKGAHLSRFIEVLHETAGEITLQALPAMLEATRARLGASTAWLSASFPFFLHRAAPITGATALMDYQCWLEGEANGTEHRVTLGVQVPVTSVCPCSKAISDYGAHNQRSAITVQVRPRDEDGLPAGIWAEELIEVAEAAASSPVFPLLKRPDERHVTMRAHDYPAFVEDMTRTVAETLGRDDRIVWFAVEAASEESIHNHAAFARIQSPTSPATANGRWRRMR